MIDYLLFERALSSVQPRHTLNSEEQDFCDKYGLGFEIGRLAQRIARHQQASGSTMPIT
jgi:hypothetical protein